MLAPLRIRTIACLGLLTAGLAGCVESKVGVQLDSEGAGTRRIEISWEAGTLEELELSDEELRGLLDADPARGWTMTREPRYNEHGQNRQFIVFRRESSFDSLEDWARRGADLSVRAAPDRPPRLHGAITIETGAGAGYRTLEYRETLDARSVKDLLDRTMAERIARKVGEAHPEIGDEILRELRGIYRAHLFHMPSLVIDDDQNEQKLEEFLAVAAPHTAWVLADDHPDASAVEATRELLEEIFKSSEDDMDGFLTHEAPGISLLAFMTLKFEISVAGRIVETNADRRGEGFAAWERPVWAALDAPIELFVRSRIEE